MIPWLTLLFTVIIARFTLSDKKAIYLYLLGGAYLFYFLVQFIMGLTNDYQVNRQFKYLHCTIINSRVHPSGFSNFVLYSPEFTIRYFDEKNIFHTQTIPLSIARTAYLQYHYAESLVQRYPIGSEQICWNDPAYPDRIVLQRGWFKTLESPVLLLLASGVLSVMLLVRAWRMAWWLF